MRGGGETEVEANQRPPLVLLWSLRLSDYNGQIVTGVVSLVIFADFFFIMPLCGKYKGVPSLCVGISLPLIKMYNIKKSTK